MTIGEGAVFVAGWRRFRVLLFQTRLSGEALHANALLVIVGAAATVVTRECAAVLVPLLAVLSEKLVPAFAVLLAGHVPRRVA